MEMSKGWLDLAYEINSHTWSIDPTKVREALIIIRHLAKVLERVEKSTVLADPKLTKEVEEALNSFRSWK